MDTLQGFGWARGAINTVGGLASARSVRGAGGVMDLLGTAGQVVSGISKAKKYYDAAKFDVGLGHRLTREKELQRRGQSDKRLLAFNRK